MTNANSEFTQNAPHNAPLDGQPSAAQVANDLGNWHAVTLTAFTAALSYAKGFSAKVDAATPSVREVVEGLGNASDCQFILGYEGKAGFIVKGEGELVADFSLLRGKGYERINEAKYRGAIKLDCFAGFLVELYQLHGFVTYKRVPNWVKGEPSVHFMQLFAEGIA